MPVCAGAHLLTLVRVCLCACVCVCVCVGGSLSTVCLVASLCCCTFMCHLEYFEQRETDLQESHCEEGICF